MKLEGKNILLISPEPWSKMKVSKHHYAEYLAKNNEVFFLNPPSEKYHLNQLTNQLYIIDYQRKYKGLQLLPKWINAILIKKEFDYLQKKVNQNFDVIWNFDPSRFFNLIKIKCVKICHIVDWNQKFQRKTLAQTADICLSSSSFLTKELGKYNKHSYFINHGYAKRKLVQIDLSDKKDVRIKAGYVGNLNILYLDWCLIHQVVNQHPEVLFYFLGPYNLDTGDSFMKSVYCLDNTRFTGKVNADLVPSYLAEMDLLFLAYRADEFPKQLANPHKMLEYLGSGKPIVSTYTDQYQNYPHLLLMSNQNNTFHHLFSKGLSDIDNLSHAELSNARISLAQANGYDQHLKQIEHHLTCNTTQNA